MLTLLFILLVIVHFGHNCKNTSTEKKENKYFRWSVFAWVFIILVIFHGC